MLLTCPFCGSIPILSTDIQSGKYKLECEKCKEYNTTIISTGDTIEEVYNLWNRRYNKVEATNKILHGKELVLDSVIDEPEFIPDLFGFLVFSDGEILVCDMYDHEKIIIERFNLKVDPKTFDHTKYCGENGIVKISVFKGSLAIDLPIIMTKKQKDHIFEALSIYPELKTTQKFSLFSYKSHEYLIFYSLEELLEKLDKIKV